MEGVKTVLARRSKFLPPRQPLTDPMKYVDLELHGKAFPGALTLSVQQTLSWERLYAKIAAPLY